MSPAGTLHVGRVPRAVRREDLAGAGFLAGLPARALDELAAVATRRRLAPGTMLFHEGDPGHSLFVVAAGGLKVVRPTIDDSLVLDRLAPGQLFGELAVLNRVPRLASVIAVDESEVIEIAGSDFEAVLDRNPAAMRRLLGRLAESLTLAKEELIKHNHVLELRVQERTHELHESQLEVVRRLAQVAESRDYETGQHITRMSRMCALLGRAAGLDPREAEDLLYAAPMHDIGKVAMPDHVLLKPGPLSPEEWELMKTHTTVGAAVLKGSRSPIVQKGEVIALSHHERWDGTGYPHGLAGEDIPLLGRIAAICDVFDALLSHRPYKGAWSFEDAFAEISAQRGRHFDPRLVDLFLELTPTLPELLGEPVSPALSA